MHSKRIELFCTVQVIFITCTSCKINVSFLLTAVNYSLQTHRPNHCVCVATPRTGLNCKRRSPHKAVCTCTVQYMHRGNLGALSIRCLVGMQSFF